MLDKFIAVPAFNAETAFVYRMVSAWRDTAYNAFINMEVKTAAAAAVWTYCRNFIHEEILLQFAIENN